MLGSERLLLVVHRDRDLEDRRRGRPGRGVRLRDRDRVGVGAEVLHGDTVVGAGKTKLVGMQEPFKKAAASWAVRTGQPRRRTPFTVKRSTLRT